MLKQKPYIRIFDPVFTYERADDTREWSALCSYLHMTNRLAKQSDTGEPYALQTAYYRYADNIAVLWECEGVIYCQTFIDGVEDRCYEVLALADELRAFFEACGDNLTVLDNDRSHELIPCFDPVLTYAQCFAEARAIGEKHRDTMSDYVTKLTELQKEFEDLLCENVRNTYADGVRLAEQYLITLDALSDEIRLSEFNRIHRCILEDEYNIYRIFGLFVYAVLHGIERGRHLRRRSQRLSVGYSDMLDEMRLFISLYQGVEEDYARYMHLPANERAKLHALLEDEGVFDENNKFIGGDIF